MAGAWLSPRRNCRARMSSSPWVRRVTRPMACRYCRTGSVEVVGPVKERRGNRNAPSLRGAVPGCRHSSGLLRDHTALPVGRWEWGALRCRSCQ